MLVASHVAHTYFQLARLNDQLRVARQALAQREHALALVRDRVSAGLDTRLELRQSEGGLPDARLQIEILQEQLNLARLALAALVGEPTKALSLADTSILTVRSVAVTSAVPSDLLGRRADIAAARWRVEAASQDVSSAQAQFYPNINLVAFAGLSSIGLDRLVNAGSEQWGVGPALRLPLFDGGRLRANLRGKDADLEGAIGSYNSAVIEAVREVSGLLASLQAISRQQTEQQAALALSEDAYGVAVQRYEAGLSNYLSVLATEAAVLQQRRQGVDLSARAIDTQVSLMHALGGGYRAELPATLAHKHSFSQRID
jgi:NodT family efflux transporter outer membrane factor (OMF) lipoprotein